MARRDRRRREAGALAASLLAHAVLLAVLARVAIPAMYAPPSAPAPSFQLQLVAEPPLASRTAPRASANARASHALPVPAAPHAAAEPRSERPVARAVQAPPRPPPPRAPQAAPAPPSHATASIPAAGASNGAQNGGGAAGAGRWRVQGEGEDEDQDGVRRFLRATVGCSHEDYARLTPAERAYCDRRMGRDARMMGSAQVDTVGGAKRGYYAAVQDAYQAMHDARPEYDAQGARIIPGHGPGLGCRFGADGVKCAAKPPQGVGTEEAGVPPP